MKKLVTVFALCAAMSAVAQVESANIVGYSTVTIDKAWSIIAVNFQAAGGADISLQTAIPYSAGMTTGAASTSADSIQIQTAGGYDTYFMGNGLIGKTSYPETNQKWVKSGEFAATALTIKPGTAFWYGAKNYAEPFNITVAGQVLITDTNDMPITLAVKHIANPYATDLPLNNGIPFVTGMTTGAASTSADTIQIQTAVGYDTYFLGNGLIGKTSYPETNQKWVKSGEFAATTAIIPSGKGAWYLRRGVTDFNITITRPFSL